jgi:glyoxylate reductase
MPRILITRAIPEPAIQKLKEVFEVVINPFDRPMTRCEILASITDCDALISMLSDSIDTELMQAAPRLRVVANYAVGYNNIDLNAAQKHKITICNTPGVLTESTADLAWALLMAAARRLLEADALMRSGEFTGWEPMMLLGADIHAKTLGIIGMGRIGQAVARRATGFGMKIIYSGKAKDLDFCAENVDLDTLLQTSDFISLHVPITPDTHHLIVKAEIARMKSSAILINTARGAVVDEAELVQALQKGSIAGAGLDVYEHEPEMQEGLAELKNVVLAPHIGSASTETRIAMGLLAASNAIAVIQGKEPPAKVV